MAAYIRYLLVYVILPPSCAVVMKSGNFNFLEPSGPLQACNGTAALVYVCCTVRQ